MLVVNISEFRRRISFYLAKVKEGKVVIIARRNIPFAKIVPLKTDGV